MGGPISSKQWPSPHSRLAQVGLQISGSVHSAQPRPVYPAGHDPPPCPLSSLPAPLPQRRGWQVITQRPSPSRSPVPPRHLPSLPEPAPPHAVASKPTSDSR